MPRVQRPIRHGAARGHLAPAGSGRIAQNGCRPRCRCRRGCRPDRGYRSRIPGPCRHERSAASHGKRDGLAGISGLGGRRRGPVWNGLPLPAGPPCDLHQRRTPVRPPVVGDGLADCGTPRHGQRARVVDRGRVRGLSPPRREHPLRGDHSDVLLRRQHTADRRATHDPAGRGDDCSDQPADRDPGRRLRWRRDRATARASPCPPARCFGDPRE